MSSIARRNASVVALCTIVLTLAGCGGGGGGGGGATPTPPVQNAQAVFVGTGPVQNIVNLLFTSVTICVPGDSAKCQTIDHVLVDTGSSGFRVFASALNPATLPLPAQTDAVGSPIVECMQFVDGFSWGPVKLADVMIAGKSAGAVPIQVIGDAAYPTIPADCSSTGPPENTVADFAANGVLGVGYFLQDCGTLCVSSTNAGLYYRCPTAITCQATTLAVNKQVANPAAMFASDNNGVIIDLPAISPAGAATVNGTLIFGIGTQANNALGNAIVVPVQAQTGNVTTVYGGRSYPSSFFDSGSGAMYFGAREFPICNGNAPGFYCPASLQTLSASVRGTNGISVPVTFNVANGDSLFSANPTFKAFNDLAAPNDDPTSFDWGITFFYGRRVYTAFEGASTPGGNGPYIAF
jgi:Protein of unknown function (DUF3443)